jgi:hypothetical protein
MTTADPDGTPEPDADRDLDPVTPEWLLSTDERLLAYFAVNGPCRCSRAAGDLGLHVPFARRRCDALRRNGYLMESDGRFRLTGEGRTLADAADLGDGSVVE